MTPTPTPTCKKFTAWSFSRYSDYVKCPLRAKLKHIDRLPEPKGDALVRGSAIHTLAEKYLTGRIKRMPVELKTFEVEFKTLKKHALLTEQQWAFDTKWSPCDWFGSRTWCRMVVDVAVETSNKPHLAIIDHKTGKVREESREQLELYALGGFKMFSHIEEITSKFWYLDQGVEVVEKYTRDDLPKLVKAWAKKIKPMMNDRTFAPRPGDGCRWCFFSAAKGGPCEY